MPYRRLPNTDSARLKALRTALNKGMEQSLSDLAVSSATFQRLRNFLPSFEHELIQFRATFNIQVEKNKDYLELQKKSRLYISHFLQVLNFAIARGELPASARNYYGLGENNHKIPLLNTDVEIIKWGEQVVKGETNRIGHGGNIITNPTSALVNVWYEKFRDAYRFQKNLQKNTNRAMSKVYAMRAEADNIIISVWNEVEDKFKHLPDEEKREMATEYGLVFFFRKTELINESDSAVAEERALKLLGALDNNMPDIEEKDKLQYSLFFSENRKN